MFNTCDMDCVEYIKKYLIKIHAKMQNTQYKKYR